MMKSSFGQGSVRGHVQALVAFLFVASVLLLLLIPFGGRPGSSLSHLRSLPGANWAWIPILVPPVLVLQHAFYLSFIKQKALRGSALTGPTAPRHGPRDEGDLHETWNAYFQPATLLLRYGLPAVLLACVGMLHFGLFLGGWQSPVPVAQGSLPAARIGLAGAYAYVLIYLGLRSYRADLTSGGAIWCVVTLLMGPVLAILAGLAVKLQETDSFAQMALYFAAGLSPRRIVEWMVASARRGIGDGQLSSSVLNNKDLLCIRGITPAIAARLQEEGVEDAYGLAMADPTTLLRNTSFPPSQILAWMDEALMHFYLPDTADELVRKKGISGAIDLAHLGLMAGLENHGSAQTALAELAPLLGGAAQAEILLTRINEDAQLVKIWRLYNMLDAGAPQAFSFPSAQQ